MWIDKELSIRCAWLICFLNVFTCISDGYRRGWCFFSIYNSFYLEFLFRVLQVSITNMFVSNTSDFGLSVIYLPPTPALRWCNFNTHTGQNATVCWNRPGVKTPQTFPSSTRLCPLSCSSQRANIPWRSTCSRNEKKSFYSPELMVVWLVECTLEPKDPQPPSQESRLGGVSPEILDVVRGNSHSNILQSDCIRYHFRGRVLMIRHVIQLLQ